MKTVKTSFGTLLASIFALMGQAAHSDSIEGTVTVKGSVPAAKELKVDADPKCKAIHKGKGVPNEAIVANGGKLQWVLVYVKDAKPGGKLPAAAMIDQMGCRYTPHVLGLMKGQELQIKSSDPLMHNIHPTPKINAEFNVSQPSPGVIKGRKFDKVETTPFKVKCNVHKWMSAWVAVFDHPFFAVSDKDGKFKINGIPAGSYTVEAWHEKLGTKSAKVTVKGSGKTDFSFEVK